MASIVLTVIGDDQPGLVDKLAATIEAHGGNWEESRMAHLDAKFAGLLRVTAADTAVEPLTRALAALERDDGLHIRVETSLNSAAASASQLYSLELTGQDRPGIVHEIGRIFARHGANIETLETATRPAQMTGGTLFEARAQLSVSGAELAAAIGRDLEALANEMIVELQRQD